MREVRPLTVADGQEPQVTFTSSHWGVHEVHRDAEGRPTLAGFREDPDPSPIGLDALDAAVASMRVARPAVRSSWLEHGAGSFPERRGLDPFIEVEWDEALELVAGELRRVIDTHGNEAVYGGSYGWASAGRFHHALGQVHRFLNLSGGYVRHVNSYSTGAARVVLPHVIATMDDLGMRHTSWEVMAEHTELFVSFGGLPLKNGSVTGGGPSSHRLKGGIEGLSAAGIKFINVSPVREDLVTTGEVEWIPLRPGTDTALLLGIAHTLLVEDLHDREFLERCTLGFDAFASYVLGERDGVAKDAEWAAALCDVEATRIRDLAHEMSARRTMLNMALALQRAHHGEQPFWALVTVAAMLGQIGLPGGGFGLGYGAMNHYGSPTRKVKGPTFPQGVNRVEAFIPCARIADLLLHPGEQFAYDGKDYTYPDIRFVYWAGGNPYHHHQDLHRLVAAWRRPEAVIVNEQFWTATARMADIVLPATTAHERDDIGFATLEPHMIAMRKVRGPYGQALDDHEIFRRLAAKMGFEDQFTESRTPMDWLRHMYAEFANQADDAVQALPTFDEWWEAGYATFPDRETAPVLLDDFRVDPQTHPLDTASGLIEITSPTIAGFDYPDCPGHPTWLEPAEWLGSRLAERYPLHLLSDQPRGKLHSQLDHAGASMSAKRAGREPVLLSQSDAAARGLADGDVVRVFNDRGSCLAVATVSTGIRPGVVRISTGAWFDPVVPGDRTSLERHGNPNVLTLDIGASSLSQGCSAQTCLVEIERFAGEPPPVRAHVLPAFAPRPQ